MKYRILNTSGNWWTGECWGVEQAAEVYNTIEDLREVGDLETNDGEYMCLEGDYYRPEAWIWQTEDGSVSASVK